MVSRQVAKQGSKRVAGSALPRGAGNLAGSPPAKKRGWTPAAVIVAVFAGSAAIAAGLFLLDNATPATPASDPRAGASLPQPSDEAIAAESPADPRATAVHAELSASDRKASPRPPAERGDGPCPLDMVLVEGDFCPFVAHKCATPRAPKAGAPAPARGEPVCEKFKDQVLCEGALVTMRVCVDQYEYPNVKGVVPAVLVDFDEAASACAVEDKRLCTVREWTFACETEAVFPYPTGLERAKDLCNWDAGPEGRVVPSKGPTVAAAMAAADKRQPSGERPKCVGPFGVYDLAGNVAEWTLDPMSGRASSPFVSVIAGGAWGATPSTCRASDADHPPAHRAGTLGFRCCQDPVGESAHPPTTRKGDGLRPITTHRAGAASALP